MFRQVLTAAGSWIYFANVCVCVCVCVYCVFFCHLHLGAYFKKRSQSERDWESSSMCRVVTVLCLSRSHHSCACRSHKGVERECLQALSSRGRKWEGDRRKRGSDRETECERERKEKKIRDGVCKGERKTNREVERLKKEMQCMRVREW